MRIKNWTFTDFPEPHIAEDYEKVREKVRQKAEISPDVVAVLQAGGVRYPGISDIDFLVLFEKGAKEYFFSPDPRYSKEERYLMWHQVLLLGERFYEDYLYLDPLLRFVHTDRQPALFERRPVSVKPLSLSEQEQKTLDLHFCFELLQMRLADMRHYASRRLPIRATLISLKGVQYLLHVIAVHGFEDAERVRERGERFVNALNSLNEKWFSLAQEKANTQLLVLFEEGMRLTFEIAFVFNAALPALCVGRNLDVARGSDVDAIHFSSLGASYIFSRRVKDPLQAFELTRALCTEYRIPLLSRTRCIPFTPAVLPYQLSSLLASFAAGQGILSDAIRRDISASSLRVPVFWSESVAVRLRLINDLTLQYRAARSPRGEGKGYLFGNTIYQYAFGPEKLRRKFLRLLIRWSYRRALRRFRSLT